MKSFRAFFTALILIGVYYNSNGQQIANVQASIQGDNIIVTYDLRSSDANARFEIHLYSSHNNFAAPVNLVSGDVGRGITPGNAKRITWQARQELTTFTGNISFEVRGTPIAAQQEVTNPNQLIFRSPQAGDAFKVGKSMNIMWRGGLQEDVKMELYQNSILQRPIGTSANSGNFNWELPAEKSLKGNNYSIKLFNISQPESAVLSGEFRIKGKTPLVIYILPAAVVAGVVLPFLLKGGGGEDACAVDPCSSPACPGYTEAACNPLPSPPALPGNE